MDIKQRICLVLILVISALLRFYNLMHDSPYFFNPDERNMANAISQFRLPNKLSQIPICLISQIRNDPGSSSRSNDPGSSKTDNCNLNPHFFAYGQFPLYLAYASDILTRKGLAVLQGPSLNNYLSTSFSSAIFWLRFWSALSSTLTVLFVYLITKKLLTNYASKFSVVAALCAAFTPGLIQSAHFGTTESFLTFFFMVSIYLSLRYLSNLSHLRYILLLSLSIGLALGSKLTGLFFFITPLTALMIQIIKLFKKKKGKLFIGLLGYWVIGLFILIGSISFFILSSPYNFIDFPDFKSAVFGYEQDVATGKYEAFYTRQFVNTTPILFQAEKIFPYALGWPVFILGSLGIMFLIFELFTSLIKFMLVRITNYGLRITERYRIANIRDSCFVILASFFIYLLPNSFLFAKWTRFMTPVFPFFAIFSAFALFKIYSVFNVNRSQFPIREPSGRFQFPINVKISEINKLNNLLGYWVIGLLVFIGSITPGMAFMSIYTHEDTRVQASSWIYKNIPNNSYILSETANVVDIPLSLLTMNYELRTKNYTVISFDFYHLEKNPVLFEQLLNHLDKADYILIPSRRIFSNHLRLPKTYPLVTKYYQLLFSGKLGFEKVKEISSYPKLEIGNWKLEIVDEQSEETYTVFDHPVIRIYRKVKPFTIDEYRSLFNI